MKRYRNRVIDSLLARKLRSMGAVLMLGPKWCGKTTTCEQLAKSILYVGDPDTLQSNRQLADIDIKTLLRGEKPRLIDEWQVIPKFWDAVRFNVDHADDVGQFMLTGSAVPPDSEKIVHSGTGRIARIVMRPMTLWESGESEGGISLKNLFDKNIPDVSASKKLSLQDIAYMICRGGWPQSIVHGVDRDDAIGLAKDYLDAVVETDVSRVDGVSREPSRILRLLRSYSRLQGTQSNLSVIRADMMANDKRTLSDETVASYLEALRKIFVVEDMPAWCPNLRSKAQVRVSDTRYFVDPSIAAASMGIGPGDLLRDLPTAGMLFETMAIRDLRVYADALDGRVCHYHDSNGLECDAVIHLRNGLFGLIEIKLGGDTLIEEGVKVLNRLEKNIDTKRMGMPAFKMVLTAVGDFAYRRKDDGIIVCPLGCLAP